MMNEKNSGFGRRVCLVCYADDRHAHKGGHFLANQEKLCESAVEAGIDDIRRWDWELLKMTPFYAENAAYLDKNRFENGAAWKPYIVLEALKTTQQGDFIIYYDCGPHVFREPLEELFGICTRNGGTLFHQWGDSNTMWSKRDAFVYMNCDIPRIHNAVHVQNTWFILRNLPGIAGFVSEWLSYNLDERIASYVKPSECGLPELDGFVENRGDQSIASILIAKYGIQTFKGCDGNTNRDINAFALNMAANKDVPSSEP